MSECFEEKYRRYERTATECLGKYVLGLITIEEMEAIFRNELEVDTSHGVSELEKLKKYFDEASEF